MKQKLNRPIERESNQIGKNQVNHSRCQITIILFWPVTNQDYMLTFGSCIRYYIPKEKDSKEYNGNVIESYLLSVPNETHLRMQINGFPPNITKEM